MCDSVSSHPWSFNLSNMYNHQTGEGNVLENPNVDHYYNLENVSRPQNFFCEVCNKGFYSHFQFQKHNNEHVECPFPECGLKANMKMIDQHISHQHMLVNFEALQIDDEAWIAERKKRFPSMQRAELRRTEQIERLKRGERLGKNNTKFGNDKTKGRNPSKFKKVHDNENKERNVNSKAERTERIENKERKENGRNIYSKFQKRDKYVTHDSACIQYDSDPEIKLGIPAFKGTTSFYENTGEISLFGIKTNKSTEEQMELNISDEEEWHEPSTNVEVTKSCVLQNALGSLMGAYESDSDASVNLEDNSAQTIVPEVKKEKCINDVSVTEQKSENADVKTEESHTTENAMKRKRKHCRSNRRDNVTNSNEKKFKDNGQNKFNKYRRRTLLEKLLEPEIVHERNVILQCVRHIVDNNFFNDKSLEERDVLNNAKDELK